MRTSGTPPLRRRDHCLASSGGVVDGKRPAPVLRSGFEGGKAATIGFVGRHTLGLF
jgi:hypothetical protein